MKRQTAASSEASQLSAKFGSSLPDWPISASSIDQRVLAVDRDVGDRLEKRFGGRCGILAAVVVDRRQHVFDGERLAVVELDALANLEAPDSGVVRGLPAFRQIGLELAGLADLRQHVVGGEVDLPHEVVLIGPRIERVGRRAVPDTGPYVAALFRRLRDGLAGQCRGKSDGDAKGRRAAHEFAPRDLAVLEELGIEIELFHDVISQLVCFGREIAGERSIGLGRYRARRS